MDAWRNDNSSKERFKLIRMARQRPQVSASIFASQLSASQSDDGVKSRSILVEAVKLETLHSVWAGVARK